MVNKKEWLDYLYYYVGKQRYDFFVCGLKLLKNKEIFATKWKKYSEVCFNLNPWEDFKIQWVNQRQVLPNELVLDIEEKNRLKEIIKKLEDYGFSKFYIYTTESKGFHIHLFFNEAVSKETKEFFCKKFGADTLKSGGKVMIALENCPHWKSNKLKTLVKNVNRI